MGKGKEEGGLVYLQSEFFHIAMAVTRRHQSVVIPRRGILDDCQNRRASVRVERIVDLGQDLVVHGTGVLHGHSFCNVMCVEGPGVDDLLPGCVD